MSQKNARTLASYSFNKHGIISIIFSLLLVCVSWAITGQPQNSVFICSVADISQCQGQDSASFINSMDQYAEEKRTEKNYLVVCSGIFEAETTNNKRLWSTFCIEAIQTRSIARPLCDSRASCWKCGDAVDQKISKLFHAYWNYNLLKLAHFLRHTVELHFTVSSAVLPALVVQWILWDLSENVWLFAVTVLLADANKALLMTWT